MIRALRWLLANGIEWVCLALMAILAIDLMLGVFSRYVLVRTFTWYDEIARMCFIWVVFLGAAIGVKRGSHFGLNLLVANLSAGAQRAAAAATAVVIVGFSLVLIVQGLDFLEIGRFQQLPVMGISKIWVYAAMPIGGALMALFALGHLWKIARGAA